MTRHIWQVTMSLFAYGNYFRALIVNVGNSNHLGERFDH